MVAFVDQSPGHHSVLVLTLLLFIGAIALALIAVGVRAMWAAWELPRRRLDSHQRRVVAGVLGSEVVGVALGALIGYLTATGSAIVPSVVGGVVGAFAWLVGCWIAGGVLQWRRRAGSASE